MARIETRQFGSVKHLLVIAENQHEAELFEKLLGRDQSSIRGQVIFSDDAYLRLVSNKSTLVEDAAKHEMRKAALRLLASSWKDIRFKYEGLTEEEQQAVTKEQFKMLVRELKSEGLA